MNSQPTPKSAGRARAHVRRHHRRTRGGVRGSGRSRRRGHRVQHVVGRVFPQGEEAPPPLRPARRGGVAAVPQGGGLQQREGGAALRGRACGDVSVSGWGEGDAEFGVCCCTRLGLGLAVPRGTGYGVKVLCSVSTEMLFSSGWRRVQGPRTAIDQYPFRLPSLPPRRRQKENNPRAEQHAPNNLRGSTQLACLVFPRVLSSRPGTQALLRCFFSEAFDADRRTWMPACTHRPIALSLFCLRHSPGCCG